MEKNKIAVLVGSLRKESFSRKVAQSLSELAPKSLDLQIIEIGGLSFYNQDLDANPPESWVQFRNKIKECAGVLFVTPEYNRSVPGVLKNAIDIASRPYGSNALNGMPGAVVSVSPGAAGAFGANHHLRQSLVFLNVLPLQQPEAYVGNASKLFNEKGQLQESSTREFFLKFMTSFAGWVNSCLKEQAAHKGVA